MIDRKEIELLIRAQLKGEKDITSISKAIDDLGQAIERQSSAAKKGESSIDELKASLQALRQAQEQLTSRADLVGRFQRLAESVQTAQERVDRSRASYDKYAESLRDVDAVTDKQQQKLTKLSATYERAQGSLERQQKTYAGIGNALREAGVDTDNLARAENDLRQAAAKVGETFLRGQQAIENYADDVRSAREATAALGKEQRDAARDADLFAAAEQRAAKAAEQRARDAQTFLVERPLERRGQAAAGSRADLEAQAALQRQRELADLRRDIEERSAQAAREQSRDAGLRKTADDAEAAARSYTTLARASTNLRPKVVSLREAINSIIDPAGAARTSLVGVEKQVADLSGALDPAKNSIREYQERIRELQAAQKAISGQSALIDDFRKQTAALREQRAELSQARAQVAQYAAAVRAGGDAAAQFTQPLAEAEARLRRASVALRQQTETTRQARDALRQAGIDSRNLADAQDRLSAAARKSTAAVNQLAEGARNVGSGAKQATSGFSLFNDEGRTTLSLAQRIRGEILALTAAYVGLQGIISLAADSLRASTGQEGLRNTLAFALGGDGAQVTQQIEYLRKEAERLGIAFDEASKAYAKFAAAAIRSGAPVQEAQFIFESFAEVGRVINLTPDQINGIFNALGQSFSKGKIQAEELRQQIGERLPGAFAFAQEALKDVFPDLDKALEGGKVGAENLLVIAESVRKAAAGQLPAAIRSLDSEQQRFNNSVLFFKQEIADSGFGQAYIALLKELTTLLKSEDGKQFAQNLSSVFAGVADVIRFLVENFRELQLVVGIVAGLLGVKLFGTLISGAIAAKAAIAGTTVALTAMQKALFVLGAFVVGWNFGSYLRDEFVEVEKAGIQFVRFMLILGQELKATFFEIFLDLPRVIANTLKASVNLFNNVFFTPVIRALNALAKALGLDGVAENLEKALGALTLKLNVELGAGAQAARDAANREIANIKAITDQQLADAETRRQPAKAAPGVPTTTPGKRAPKAPGPTEGEIGARQRKIEALDNALNALDAKIQRADTQTLQSQLDAFDIESKRLQKQIDEIRKFDPKAAAAAQARFEQLAGEQRAAIIAKFNRQIESEREALLKKVESAEAAAGRKERLNLQARQDAIRKDYAALYRQIEQDREKAVLNGLPTAELDALRQRTALAEQARLDAEALAVQREELQSRENQINDTLKAREQVLRNIAALVKAGTISQADGDALSTEAIKQFQPQIDGLATSSAAFAESLRGAVDPAVIDEFLAKLALARDSGAQLGVEFDRVGTIIRNGVGAGVDAVLNNAIDKLTEVSQKTADWGDVFDSVGKTILQSLAQILREIGTAILRQQILIALRAAGVPVAHSGMVVGQGSNRSRNVSPMMFAGAPRYHTGGIVGLAPDEYPAILQKNEEVLSKGDPRNVLNGGGMQRAAQPMAQRFVLVDDTTRIPEAMAGSEGESVTMLHIKRNLPTLRQLIKGG